MKFRALIYWDVYNPTENIFFILLIVKVFLKHDVLNANGVFK